MDRPEDVSLPTDFREPLGTITVKQLVKYSGKSDRLLLSVYGDIFDVSDRPDKYGDSGPYACFSGKDITWGLVSGADTEENCNRFYDLFKAEDQVTEKLQGLCSWLAFYIQEYGEPVGRLEEFSKESELPPPPLDEIEGCVVM